MNFASVNSLEELKKLGSFCVVKKELIKVISPLKFTARSFKELYDVLLKIQENWIPLSKAVFVSKQAEIVFCLLHCIPKHRNEMLGITDELYMDKEKAKKWFKRMCRIVHPDYGGDANAFVVLTELYKNMIEDDYDDK